MNTVWFESWFEAGLLKNLRKKRGIMDNAVFHKKEVLVGTSKNFSF